MTPEQIYWQLTLDQIQIWINLAIAIIALSGFGFTIHSFTRQFSSNFKPVTTVIPSVKFTDDFQRLNISLLVENRAKQPGVFIDFQVKLILEDRTILYKFYSVSNLGPNQERALTIENFKGIFIDGFSGKEIELCFRNGGPRIDNLGKSGRLVIEHKTSNNISRFKIVENFKIMFDMSVHVRRGADLPLIFLADKSGDLIETNNG